MVYTYLYNEVLAAGKTTDPLFTSVTAANIVEGQLDEKEVDIPINYYAIQALNTGEGSTAAERAAKAWEKYVNQNNGQKGQVTAPQSEPEQTEDVYKRQLVLVTNEIFSDGYRYEEETMEYQRILGNINVRLAEMADCVTEVVYGIPVRIKKE